MLPTYRGPDEESGRLQGPLLAARRARANGGSSQPAVGLILLTAACCAMLLFQVRSPVRMQKARLPPNFSTSAVACSSFLCFLLATNQGAPTKVQPTNRPAACRPAGVGGRCAARQQRCSGRQPGRHDSHATPRSSGCTRCRAAGQRRPRWHLGDPRVPCTPPAQSGAGGVPQCVHWARLHHIR